QPLSSDQIEKNISELKRKLCQETTALYQRLYSDINKIPIQELTWKNPLANQIIKDDSNIIQKLRTNLKKAFMKPVRLMKPRPISKVENICGEFISNFIPENS
ncbi:7532_t:CDS:2, partial [Entrophospora sp. SA101]